MQIETFYASICKHAKNVETFWFQSSSYDETSIFVALSDSNLTYWSHSLRRHPQYVFVRFENRLQSITSCYAALRIMYPFGVGDCCAHMKGCGRKM